MIHVVGADFALIARSGRHRGGASCRCWSRSQAVNRSQDLSKQGSGDSHFRHLEGHVAAMAPIEARWRAAAGRGPPRLHPFPPGDHGARRAGGRGGWNRRGVVPDRPARRAGPADRDEEDRRPRAGQGAVRAPKGRGRLSGSRAARDPVQAACPRRARGWLPVSFARVSKTGLRHDLTQDTVILARTSC